MTVTSTDTELTLREPPKPRFRGRIHQFASFVSIPASIVLIILAPGLGAHGDDHLRRDARQHVLDERDLPPA